MNHWPRETLPMNRHGSFWVFTPTTIDTMKRTRPVRLNIMAYWPNGFQRDFGYANSYLEAANGYGKDDDRKKAIQHMLTIDPDSNNSGLWRNLLDAAEKAKDKALMGQILAWMKKSEAKHGKELVYATDIGDRLTRNGLADEAKQWWQRPQQY